MQQLKSTHEWTGVNNIRSNNNNIRGNNHQANTSSSSIVIHHSDYYNYINSRSTESIATDLTEAATAAALKLHNKKSLPDHLLLMESSLHHSQHSNNSNNPCYNGKNGTHSMVIKTQIGARKVSPASPSTHPHPHPVSAPSGSTLVSNVRVIRLKKTSNSPLGFSVKGGMKNITFKVE